MYMLLTLLSQHKLALTHRKTHYVIKSLEYFLNMQCDFIGRL
jgi:hypothetical protein